MATTKKVATKPKPSKPKPTRASRMRPGVNDPGPVRRVLVEYQLMPSGDWRALVFAPKAGVPYVGVPFNQWRSQFGDLPALQRMVTKSLRETAKGA